jgi:cytochrome c
MGKNINLTENKMIDPSITNASELISKSDCVACHMIDKKLTGPAWIDVSKKYTLSDSVIKYLFK